MGLRDGLANDITAAMKAGEKLKTSTLRLLLNAIKNKEKELRRELSEEEAASVVSTLVKQRHDSVEQFRNGGRPELADKEAAEIEILKVYLPEQLSTDEVAAIIDTAATELGAESMKDMGRLMKEVMPKVKGRADGKLVNELVKKRLGG